MALPAEGPPLRSEQLYRTLDELASSLLYPSETDAPISVFLWDTTERGALTLDALLDYFGIPSSLPSVEVPPQEFFEGVTDIYEWHQEDERAAAERFHTLRDLFFTHTSGHKHYWVGEHRVDVFLWGRARDGNYVGFKTIIVET
ncbi:MAG: sugar-non-specific nuclease inhibitor NuiA-like protein [Candidatus Kapaibacterium sp.]|nr:MAG: sugar-non-specific nuclease inhibitor NuiA-like protein [Candidatus Kapabacteria bacterium]